jgi:hypothetical protein
MHTCGIIYKGVYRLNNKSVKHRPRCILKIASLPNIRITLVSIRNLFGHVGIYIDVVLPPPPLPLRLPPSSALSTFSLHQHLRRRKRLSKHKLKIIASTIKTHLGIICEAYEIYLGSSDRPTKKVVTASCTSIFTDIYSLWEYV